MIKKLIPITLALAAMFCTLPMRGDSPPENVKEIPIRKVDKDDKIRSLNCIYAFYDGISSAIHTTFLSDLGLVEMTVTNLSTGEIWSATQESSTTSFNVIYVSGSQGFYILEYTTEAGDIYEGCFVL